MGKSDGLWDGCLVGLINFITIVLVRIHDGLKVGNLDRTVIFNMLLPEGSLVQLPLR